MTEEEWVKRAELIVYLAEGVGVNPGNPEFIAGLMMATYENGYEQGKADAK